MQPEMRILESNLTHKVVNTHLRAFSRIFWNWWQISVFQTAAIIKHIRYGDFNARCDFSTSLPVKTWISAKIHQNLFFCSVLRNFSNRKIQMFWISLQTSCQTIFCETQTPSRWVFMLLTATWYFTKIINCIMIFTHIFEVHLKKLFERAMWSWRQKSLFSQQIYIFMSNTITRD